MPSRQRPRVGLIAMNNAVPRLLGLVQDDAIGNNAVGGIEVQIVAIARELARRDWDVTILTGDCGRPERMIELDGLRVVQAFRATASKARKLTGRLRVLHLIRNLPVDVWMLQGIHPLAGLASFLARTSRRKFVFWLASNTDATCLDPDSSRLPRYQRPLAAYGLRKGDAVIAQTAYQQQLVRENFGRESTVIPNVWPVDSLGPGHAESPTALWVANLRWEKRPEMVLELAAAVPEVRFVMVGGPMPGNEDIYRHVLTHRHDHENFRYAGFVPFEHVGNYFENADMFINTSSVEGFPNTFLQAWDAQLPVVATFDPDDVLKRERLGYHCADIAEMAEKVRLLTADQPRRRELGRRAKQYLRDNFSMEVVIPRLESLILSLDGQEVMEPAPRSAVAGGLGG